MVFIGIYFTILLIISILSSGLKTWCLVKVSGVSMLEKPLKNINPKFDEYVKRISAFIPWFRKTINA